MTGVPFLLLSSPWEAMRPWSDDGPWPKWIKPHHPDLADYRTLYLLTLSLDYSRSSSTAKVGWLAICNNARP